MALLHCVSAFLLKRIDEFGGMPQKSVSGTSGDVAGTSRTSAADLCVHSHQLDIISARQTGHVRRTNETCPRDRWDISAGSFQKQGRDRNEKSAPPKLVVLLGFSSWLITAHPLNASPSY